MNKGLDLPEPLFAHCSVTLQDERIMILGGLPSSNLKLTWIVNLTDSSIVAGPSLLFDRQYSACTLFNSPMHENRPVVLVAGGGGNSSRTVEILDYTDSMAVWTESKYTHVADGLP